MAGSTPRIILVNLGTPERPDEAAVRAFLAEFLSDPLVIDLPAYLWQPLLKGVVLRSRPGRVAEQYRSIWRDRGCGPICPQDGCSPLTCATRRLAAALQQALGDGATVDWAFRYGPRNIGTALAGSAAATRVAVVPLFPQRTGSSSGSIVTETGRLVRERDGGRPVKTLRLVADAPGYVEALADRCRRTIDGAARPVDHLLMSFHGVPSRYDRKEGRTYSSDCNRTGAALVAALGWDPGRATVCYQSKFGPEPWLKPATARLLRDLPRRGVRSLAVVTPGFLTEGLETLEEIAQVGRDIFLRAGGEAFEYVPAVEDHPAFVGELATLVRDELEIDAAPADAAAPLTIGTRP